MKSFSSNNDDFYEEERKVSILFKKVKLICRLQLKMLNKKNRKRKVLFQGYSDLRNNLEDEVTFNSDLSYINCQIKLHKHNPLNILYTSNFKQILSNSLYIIYCILFSICV